MRSTDVAGEPMWVDLEDPQGRSCQSVTECVNVLRWRQDSGGFKGGQWMTEANVTLTAAGNDSQGCMEITVRM